ncbi:MAG: NUDIX domain-containing protein [Bdellovibrionaceae bacterium]|nr:NUDIX domain-containing protein [Pseudobdellovibrionaceae bacterium]
MKESRNQNSIGTASLRQVHVVCGVFSRTTAAGVFEVALFRRNDEYGRFEFPGGKVDPGETEPQALVRELKEELNLDVELAGFLGENTHDYATVRIFLRAYWVRAADWTGLHLTDHSEWRWASANEAGDLAEADVPLWELIFQKGARPKVEVAP